MEIKDTAPKDGQKIYQGNRINDFLGALQSSEYQPKQVTKILLTHKHPDHSGELRGFLQCQNPPFGARSRSPKTIRKHRCRRKGRIFYMLHGDVAYTDAALKANKLSIVFEDVDMAKQTLEKVRAFIMQNPIVYLSAHAPEAIESLRKQRIMKP